MRLKNTRPRPVATLALAGALLFPSVAPAQQTDAELQKLATGTGNPFIDNAKAGYVFRTAYFDRRSSGDETNAGNFRQRGMGLGGWLYANTGEIGDILSFGGTYNFVIPLHGPEDDSFNYILRDPGQDEVSVIGEANAKLRFGNHAFVVGRQSINQAWYLDDVVRFYNKLDQSMIGRRDVRGMQPLHYEAATVQGRLRDDTVRYYGGYVWNARQINDNEFRNIYEAAFQTTVWPDGRKTGDSDGATYVGLQHKPSKNMMVEGSYYNFHDMMDNAYVDFDYVFRLADKNYVRFGVQYMYQSGSGSNLITSGRDFDTDYWGIYGELRLIPHVVGYAMAGITDDEEEIRSPFSIGPSYLVQRIGENSKAAENTWIVGAIFDFGPFGAKGLSFDINYGQRRDRHQWSASTSGGVTTYSYGEASNWDEMATDLIYVFPEEGFFKNLRVRGRYAKVWEEDGPLVGEKRTDDLRFDVSLNIPFL